MTLFAVIRLLKKCLPWLIVLPSIIAVTVYQYTKDLPREYSTYATVSTGLTSGLSVSSGEKLDAREVTNAMDKMQSMFKSRAFQTDIALRILARHLTMTRPEKKIMNQQTFDEVNKLISPEDRSLFVVPGNELATFERLRQLYETREGAVLKQLVMESSTIYSLSSLQSRMGIKRVGGSDMLEFSYGGNDPGLSYDGLIVAIELFKEQYRISRTSENNKIVAYFEEQNQNAYRNLQKAEDEIKQYGIDNKIFNYQQQSSAVSAQREGLMASYQNELMNLKLAKVALQSIESRASDRRAILRMNEALLSKRNELANAQVELANQTTFIHDPEATDRAQRKVNRIIEDIKLLARSYYTLHNALDAVPQENLAQQWLNRMLQYEESAAKIKIYEQRIQDYEGIYEQYAPIGTNLSRMERQLAVLEKEYLNTLSNLNAARLRQKNMEVAGALTTVDQPIFPNQPQPSKHKSLVLMGFGAGMVLVLAIGFLIELLNTSIRTPERAEELTELTLSAAFPAVSRQTAKYDLPYIEQCMLEQLRSAILIETSKSAPASAYHLITLFSTRRGQGRSWVGERISHQFAKAGHRVCFLYPYSPKTANQPPNTAATSLAYYVSDDFSDTAWVGSLLEASTSAGPEVFDYIFLELPNLLDTAIPAHLVSQSHLSLLVTDAQTTWMKADATLLKLYRKANRNKIFIVLNRVEPDWLRPLLGDIPKRAFRFSSGKKPKPTITSA